jgi:hypothetical protein
MPAVVAPAEGGLLHNLHPQTGAIIVRAGVRYLEGGKITKRFIEASRRTLAKCDHEAFRELAK